MCAQLDPVQVDADYCSNCIAPALQLIRDRLLRHKPADIIDYIVEFSAQIRKEIAAQAHEAAPARTQHLLPPETSAAEGAGPTSGGKFDTFVMPGGKIEDFYKGLSSRIGFPHLEFFKTMEAEHTLMAGCDMMFTTRNYGITTTAKAEWGVVVRGNTPPSEHMLHGRIIAAVNERMECAQARKAGLRMEEVIAIILYTGPMYMIYNCVLARWSSPPSMWDTLRTGNNLFTTTLSVLVSAVQKLSTITVIPDGLKLYRGTGGLSLLPAHFAQPDEYNCKGMTEWGFLSSSTDKNVALGYSGVMQGRPHAMVLEIEPSCADRGAVVSEFSQYPGEGETLFLPMSYVAQNAQQRVELTSTGHVTIIPVRVNVNLKAECLEQLEEKKKSIHMAGFEFRVSELRQKLHMLAEAGGGEARLMRDKERQGFLWKKDHTVSSYVDAQVDKVNVILARHRARAASEYSDDAVYRGLVAESLEAARMAESALLWWMRDEGQNVCWIDEVSLRTCHRMFESFLRLQYMRSFEGAGRRAAAVDLCKARNLIRLHANERDDNGELPLVVLSARGGSARDVQLLLDAGADVNAVAAAGQIPLHFASEQGDAELVNALVRGGAHLNQARTDDESTPVWMASYTGHCNIIDELFRSSADLNQARTDGSAPLWIASEKGHIDVVDALLRCKADVNTATWDGCTALCIASQKGHFCVVEALIRGGADVNQATRKEASGSDAEELPLSGAMTDGGSPLYVASFYGHCKVVDTLLRHGADANAATIDGATPLYIASRNGHACCVEVLIRRRADVRLAWRGSTPLQAASDNGHAHVVGILEAAAGAEAAETAQCFRSALPPADGAS
jgi:ankyrin repeat protein